MQPPRALVEVCEGDCLTAVPPIELMDVLQNGAMLLERRLDGVEIAITLAEAREAVSGAPAAADDDTRGRACHRS